MVKCMYAFDQQHRPLPQLQFLSVEFPETGDEIELGDLDLLSCEQFEKVLLKIDIVDRLEIVKVEGSVRELRGIQAVYEIVVGRE